MYLDLHILQSFAPANLNRDDTGSPKECIFGGARRARISSRTSARPSPGETTTKSRVRWGSRGSSRVAPPRSARRTSPSVATPARRPSGSTASAIRRAPSSSARIASRTVPLAGTTQLSNGDITMRSPVGPARRRR